MNDWEMCFSSGALLVVKLRL